MASVLGLYWRLIWARERSNMQYKLSFALMTLTGAFYTASDLVATVVFFEHIPLLAGWSLAEVALLYGLSAIGFSVGEIFATGFDELPRHIRQGTFDRVLVRPLGAFFQTLAVGLAFRRFGRIGQSAIILVLAMAALGIEWSPDRVLVLALTVLSGSAIYFAIFVAGAAYSFWTVQGTEVVNVFTNGGLFVTGYPLEVYAGWLRRFVTFVVPIAFVSYYPALYLLGRPAPPGLPDWVRLVSPLVACLFALVAWRLWTAGVRRYVGTGS